MTNNSEIVEIVPISGPQPARITMADLLDADTQCPVGYLLTEQCDGATTTRTVTGREADAIWEAAQ